MTPMLDPRSFGARWMLTTKAVFRLLHSGRIPSAVQLGPRTWRIPADAVVLAHASLQGSQDHGKTMAARRGGAGC